MTFGNKMRWVAGLLYGLLAVYQLYLVKFVLAVGNTTNVYFTWMYAILLAFGAMAMAVWMFHGRADLSGGARRAIVTGTVFCIIFELMTYTSQTDLINYAIYNIRPDQVDNATLQYGLMVLRLLLIILAAFFVTSAKAPDKKHLVDAEDAETADSAEEAGSKPSDGEDTADDAEVEVVEVVEVVVADDEGEEGESAEAPAEEKAADGDEEAEKKED